MPTSKISTSYPLEFAEAFEECGGRGTLLTFHAGTSRGARSLVTQLNGYRRALRNELSHMKIHAGREKGDFTLAEDVRVREGIMDRYEKVKVKWQGDNVVMEHTGLGPTALLMRAGLNAAGVKSDADKVADMLRAGLKDML